MSTLPVKKRKYNMPIEVEQEVAGYDSCDSKLIVANFDRVGDISDSEGESDEMCECCVEPGYLADGEDEELPRCNYSTVVMQEPCMMKPHAEENLENAKA
ncbi:hypothetical protein M758_11G007700 [Ceratodon purpureus]|nr:hypothetical protein M758_11G007700 [Ceratodon purpureus]